MDRVSKAKIITLYRKYILGVYRRLDIVFTRGEGSILISQDKRRYIDLFPGWGSCILGHSPDSLVKAISSQAETLIHIPNNFYHPWQAILAKEIIEKSFKKGKVFFSNSGAEAIEAALKLVKAISGKKAKIISMKGSFHGRTCGALSLTGQERYRRGFGPLIEGINYVKFQSYKELKRNIDSRTKAIFIEPIQGEGGVRVSSPEYLRTLRDLCNKKNILLVFDEVQTGMGRTGFWFAWHYYNVMPDIFCLSKGLGGGFPIGCLVVRDRFKDVLGPGMHASTFGGSPLATKVSLEVFKSIEKQNLLSRVRILSKRVFQRLHALREKYRVIKEIRGLGFMIGIELKAKGERLIQEALKNRLIINCTQDKIIRIMPALNIEEEILHKGLDILDFSFKKAYP